MVAARDEIARLRTTYGIVEPQCVRLPQALDLSFWSRISPEEARRDLGLDQAVRVVVWHGRIETWMKGLDTILDAWDVLSSRRTAQRQVLVLVGAGGDDDWLSKRLDSMPDVTWWSGFRDRDFVRKVLSAGDVYVFASRAEGFPVAPLEAMACGMPVVSTAVPGLIDVFAGSDGSNGVLGNNEGAQELADALVRLLDDEPLRRRLGEQARRCVEAEFGRTGAADALVGYLRSRGAVLGSQRDAVHGANWEADHGA
jgi:starch synthase